MYKRSWGLQPEPPETNPASGQSGTWTRDLQLSPAFPLGQAASPYLFLSVHDLSIVLVAVF